MVEAGTPVSYRDLEEMLTERGMPVDHTTILTGGCRNTDQSWINVPAGHRKTSPWFSNSWRVDETYIKVGGKWCYLYRAVTTDGDKLDFSMPTKRNTDAAKGFKGKSAARCWSPRP